MSWLIALRDVYNFSSFFWGGGLADPVIEVTKTIENKTQRVENRQCLQSYLSTGFICQYENLLSKELIKVKLPPQEDYKARVWSANLSSFA